MNGYWTVQKRDALDARWFWALMLFGGKQLSTEGRTAARRDYLRALHRCEELGLL